MRSKISNSLVLVLIVMVVGIWWSISHTGSVILNPMGEEVVRDKPYDKYSFERLMQRGGIASKIEVVGDKFYYQSEGRRISGEVNVPQGEAIGVIVMARGYVEKESYKTGIGTHNAANYFSERGYITYAPDFSGYGESDPEDENALGARLVKPVEILDLIASVQATTNLPIFLWGHSNGGQIMISVAEILGQMENFKGDSLKVKGVTLWEPVSKSFPYNILYYSDEADDQGKWLRSEIAKFESEYDVYKYSVDRYLDKIQLPIVIHQGGKDDAVPNKWSDEVVAKLKEKEKKITYYEYPQSDHNMHPNWGEVVARDIAFFESLNN